MIRKVRYIFVTLDGKVKGDIQGVDTVCWTYLYDDRFGCKRCRYKFGEFRGTYLGEFNFSLHILVHLIYLFALGVPAYRIRWYTSLSLATIERTFRVLRQSIYDESLQKLKELKLSGRIEIDEALFGGHRKGKRGWRAEGKTLVFGIYQRNGNVITFPVLDRKYDTLVPLITQHTKKGSLYIMMTILLTQL